MGRQIHHKMHVVLDQQHRDATSDDGADHTGQVFGLERIEAGGRLVKQQQLGRSRERTRHFEQALLAIRQG